jgi:hypothetical protein
MQADATMAGGTGAVPPPAGRRAWLLIGAASALGLFLLSRPYGGIIHDAELYVGRAVADADPGGLGRDIFFAHEGQSAFSIYPRLSGALLRAVGPGPGALLLTLAGLCAWLLALGLFAATLARGRVLWASVVVAATVPSVYGQAFRHAEPFATPRLPAEALVLAGLGALAVGRRWLALGLLCIGAAIHPLMAASGLAVWILVLARADRRWLLLPLGALVLVVTGAVAGLPLAGRLCQLMDPAWAEALSVNAYLFPSNWPQSAWAMAATRAATVLLALPFIASLAARRVLAAILIVAALGVVVSAIAADHWLVLLVVQAQPWRALWLLDGASALALPIAAVGLWNQGPRGRIALAWLALGWLAAPLTFAGAAAAAMAAAIVRAGARWPGMLTDRIVRSVWVAVAVFGALVLAGRSYLLIGLLAARPADASMLGFVWLFWAPSIPIVFAAIVFALRPDLRPRPAGALLGALALLVLAAITWDERPTLARITDRHQPDPELVRLLPTEPREILWLKNGSTFAWRLAGRPSWVGYTQGASIVFSRELGRVWQDRMSRLVAAHLADPMDHRPWSGSRPAVLEPSLSDIEGICRAPDGPAAIIVPLDGSVRLPEGLRYATYDLPAPRYDLGERSGTFGWQVTQAHAVVACSAGRQSGALRGRQPG